MLMYDCVKFNGVGMGNGMCCKSYSCGYESVFMMKFGMYVVDLRVWMVLRIIFVSLLKVYILFFVSLYVCLFVNLLWMIWWIVIATLFTNTGWCLVSSLSMIGIVGYLCECLLKMFKNLFLMFIILVGCIIVVEGNVFCIVVSSAVFDL